MINVDESNIKREGRSWKVEAVWLNCNVNEQVRVNVYYYVQFYYFLLPWMPVYTTLSQRVRPVARGL